MPAAHEVAHGVHEVAPAAEKVPAAHAVQPAFELPVAQPSELDVPAGHEPCVHVPAPAVEHVASAAGVQGCEMDWPSGHVVVHGAQDVAVCVEPVMPVTPAEYVLSVHGVHTLSEVDEPAVA